MTLLLQLAPFALLTAGTGLCAVVFFSLKKEIAALSQRIQEQQREMENTEQRLTAEMAEMRNQLREAEERAGVLVPPVQPRSGFNLSKRSQALRMSRLGEKCETIATSLSLPRKEVELLLKVQKIIHDNAAAAS
jgi:hypothetical protein